MGAKAPNSTHANEATVWYICYNMNLQYKWHVSQDHEVTNIQSWIIYPKKWLTMLSEREGGGMKKLKGIFGAGSSQVRCSLWLSQFLSLFGQKVYLGDGNRQVLVISSYHHIIISTGRPWWWQQTGACDQLPRGHKASKWRWGSSHDSIFCQFPNSLK